MNGNEELAQVWRQRLDDLAQSGLSVRQWCEQHHYSKGQYTYWRRRLADDAQTTPAAPVRVRTDWLPVQAAPPAPTPPSCLTLRIAGVHIDLSAGFDTALLRAVVAALESPPC